MLQREGEDIFLYLEAQKNNLGANIFNIEIMLKQQLKRLENEKRSQKNIS